MFLAVLKKTIIDVPFQAEIVEDLVADPPVVGVPEVSEESHLEANKVYIEDSGAQVAKNLEAGLPIDYYNISFNGVQLNASLQPVSVKGGARASAPDREVVEIEAGGEDVGSAVVEV
jgi:hypothetical protein